MECKQSKPDIIAFHGVSCHRSTHYVRVLISKPLGLFSKIERIEEEEELTFEQFLERDFNSTEMHKETVRRMEEFDKGCCRPIHETITVRTLGYPSLDAESDFIQFISKKLIHRLLFCFACIQVPRQSRPSRWPSRPDTRLKSLYPSTEAITANDRRSQDTENPISTVSWATLKYAAPGEILT